MISDDLKNWISRYVADPFPLRLQGHLEHYAWGQTGPAAFIPQLLGTSPDTRPYAELWIGAHPASSSKVLLESSRTCSLHALIQTIPQTILGDKNVSPWNDELPFLFKIIAAATPLSIQTHPNSSQAEAAFSSKNHLEIYKDPHGKWEQIIALDDFYILSGFRPLKQIIEFLSEIEGIKIIFPDGFSGVALNELSGESQDESQDESVPIKNIFQTILSADSSAIAKIISIWIERLKLQNAAEVFVKSQQEYWILNAIAKFCSIGAQDTQDFVDRGLLLMGLLHLKILRSTESLFLEPGDVHAYLEGIGIEVMTNSDNTLRCALTRKTVHVQEMLKIASCAPKNPETLFPDRTGFYPTHCPWFKVAGLPIKKSETKIFNVSGAEILFLLKGKIVLQSAKKSETFVAGDGILIPAALKQYTVCAESEETVLYRCVIP